MTNNITVQQAAAMLKAADNILLLCHKNPDGDRYPCYRVVSSRGALSQSYAFGGIEEQKRRLEADGSTVTDCKVDLAVYQLRNGE